MLNQIKSILKCNSQMGTGRFLTVPPGDFRVDMQIGSRIAYSQFDVHYGSRVCFHRCPYSEQVKVAAAPCCLPQFSAEKSDVFVPIFPF